MSSPKKRGPFDVADKRSLDNVDHTLGAFYKYLVGNIRECAKMGEYDFSVLPIER